MRAFLDAVLSFIGATSLTDIEFEFVEGEQEDTSDQLKNYQTLDSVLDSRESVSSLRDRLRYYYLAKGVAVGELETGKSNILIGAPLC